MTKFDIDASILGVAGFLLACVMVVVAMLTAADLAARLNRTY